MQWPYLKTCVRKLHFSLSCEIEGAGGTERSWCRHRSRRLLGEWEKAMFRQLLALAFICPDYDHALDANGEVTNGQTFWNALAAVFK